MNYFGTDGIRGIAGKEFITLSYKCGKALASLLPETKILIGRDTRSSGKELTNAFCVGAMSMGSTVVDVGICPTSAICYLTNKIKFDFGVEISASHNSAEYNGIKIFNSQGEKLDEILEIQISNIINLDDNCKNLQKIGKYIQNNKIKKYYENFLLMQKYDLSGKKIVLDCANGATYLIAPKIFKMFGANVISINNHKKGSLINKNCGATNCENLIKTVLLEKADFGFAFDGDGDRVIAVDEKGNIVDGDDLLYFFGINRDINENKKSVVGTVLTNGAIKQKLIENGINVLESQVGDKNVYKLLKSNNLVVGGEQSGHIIISSLLNTGDGILNALIVSSICAKEGKSLSSYFNYKKLYQKQESVKVADKFSIIDKISAYKNNLQKKYVNNLKIIVRPSGTENVLRIFVESNNKNTTNEIMTKLKLKILLLEE